jgi:hypothetical protein
MARNPLFELVAIVAIALAFAVFFSIRYTPLIGGIYLVGLIWAIVDLKLIPRRMS